MSEKLPESSHASSSGPVKHIAVFVGGALYGILGTSEPSVVSMGSGVILSGAVEYATRPQQK